MLCKLSYYLQFLPAPWEGELKRHFLKYAKYRKKALGIAFAPGYTIPATALILGVLAAVAIISKTPGDAIKGFGDVIVLSGSDESILYAFWKCSRYHIITVLLSTSFLGVAAVPVLLGYRGFTMCCTSAILILDYSLKGALLSALIIGLPALISLPCLLLMASDAIHASSELFVMRFSLRQRVPPRYDPRRMFFCLSILMPVAFFENQIVPILISHII